MYLCHRTIVYLLLVSLRTDFFGTGILLFVARPLPAAAARLDRVGFFASFSWKMNSNFTKSKLNIGNQTGWLRNDFFDQFHTEHKMTNEIKQ